MSPHQLMAQRWRVSLHNMYLRHPDTRQRGPRMRARSRPPYGLLAHSEPCTADGTTPLNAETPR
jgi:hypothetical protein